MVIDTVMCHVWMAPVWQYDFGDVLALRVGCSHVFGLFMRHDMTAGPDVVRENRSLSHCRAVDAQDSFGAAIAFYVQIIHEYRIFGRFLTMGHCRDAVQT